MRPDRLALRAAVLSVIATAAVSAWGHAVFPERATRWLVVATFLPVIWAWVEYAQVRGENPAVGREIMTAHRCVVAWTGLMLSSRIGLRLAIHSGLLDQAWAASGRRFNGLLLGAGMILFGNALPTLRSPWRLDQQPFAWQQVHRFVGWVFVLGGLGVVGCWTLLPVDRALEAAVRITVVTVLLGLGRKVLSLFTHNSPPALTRQFDHKTSWRQL